MQTYRTANFQIRAGSADRCADAITQYVAAVKECEPGTILYLSLRDVKNPDRFIHVYAFEDAAAEEAHHQSPEAKQFTALLGPELEGPIHFGDYTLVAST